MFITTQPFILDVDYKDPNQVEILRQQLAYQYENYCYGSKKISQNTKKLTKQTQNSNMNAKQEFNLDQSSQKRIIGKEIQNSMQNDQINEAINHHQTLQSKNKNGEVNHYQIEIQKNSSAKKKRSPSPTLNQSQTIPINISQKQYQNSVYLSPLLQNCIEDEIVSQEQQRYSSVPSKKYFEVCDYSKDKLQKIYGITGNFEMSKLYERKESPKRNLSQISYQVSTAEKNQNQLSQLYDVEIKQTDKKNAEKNASFLIASNVTSINQVSHEKLNSQHQSLTAPPKTQNNSQRNSISIQLEKPKLNSQKNSQEDLQEVKKKIDYTEQYDTGKGRNSVQVMKPNNISSYSSNTYWSVSQKRNSTGFISQVQTIKNSNEDNFQFTTDQRHTHQQIKNSGIYLRNKPEYLSDPRYKLIENLNKVSQTVNIQNINNHSVRQDKKKKSDMSRVIPYFHNFIDSYKESFYHPQTSFENKYKIYNPRKSQELQKLPHNDYSKQSFTTPRNANKINLNQKDEINPLVTPFCETSYVDEDLCKIKYAKKLNQISQETQENHDDDDDQQIYQGSKNRYNCLYLNRNLRVRISRNQSPNRKKNNLVNQSVDSSLNSKKNSIQFEDPRKEYRNKQKRLEQMLNVASNNQQIQQQQENNSSDRYTPSQDSVYLKKSRNYSTPYRNSYLPQNYQQNQTNDYTLNAFVFKNSSNTSQK
ncbi:hypothetical protein TTHERM_00442500 (macronuclear) [Tetrahymena thermophila SB210]|uniref:Uncharacterized protein n=1 Tax=Tetrahymena thermophila (strain SB210) TaxID=312017 RepID=I7M6M8_TETTS|nr:hypothetical protein TTHERM_00442500 [Tetrahymena thermophila SB210]EAR85500.2 hypothetical protein TTHERM_00442500 [Tetrahymena thermophila SB210]|eukprot:XP_001033163.2 hypothetical protein TTHERM_00442500 [Tetrahymena thermophila SB210]